MRKILWRQLAVIACGFLFSVTTQCSWRNMWSGGAHQSKPSKKESSTSNQPWRLVQERTKDTVVQIIVCVNETDQLQPYQAPSSRWVFGSGFFIDADGYLLTNWHVAGQAGLVWLQLPSLGKQLIRASVVSVCPEYDVALLKVADEDCDLIRQNIGTIPFLDLGDSDRLLRSDEVLALGYPLGQASLKSTTGVTSGREGRFIQTSAPLNPGNSGGPLVDAGGAVVGINTCGIESAQNVGYALPINCVKSLLPEMRRNRLVRNINLGACWHYSDEVLAKHLHNPVPGGCYIIEVVDGGLLHAAGMQRGDMLYEIDGHRVDQFGEMTFAQLEDKVPVAEYVSCMPIGQKVRLCFYRNGERYEVARVADSWAPGSVRAIYPGYEDETDEVNGYEVFAGMVMRPLTLNLVEILRERSPILGFFHTPTMQREPVLVLTHVFGDSHTCSLRVLDPGYTLSEVNGTRVRTLAELRASLKRAATFGGTLSLRFADNKTRIEDNILITLSWERILQEEPILSATHRYPMSGIMQEILAATQG